MRLFVVITILVIFNQLNVPVDSISTFFLFIVAALIAIAQDIKELFK